LSSRPERSVVEGPAVSFTFKERRVPHSSPVFGLEWDTQRSIPFSLLSLEAQGNLQFCGVTIGLYRAIDASYPALQPPPFW